MQTIGKHPVSAGIRGNAVDSNLKSAAVAVLLDWSPERGKTIIVSLFGEPFKNDQSYVLSFSECNVALAEPNTAVPAYDAEVAVTREESTFEIRIQTHAAVLIDGGETWEPGVITVSLPAVSVRNFLDSTRQD